MGLPGSKEKILHCARALFHQSGFQATSVDDVLACCGVAKSNFYYHFKTKEHLVLAVLEWQLADYEAIIAGSLQSEHGTPTQRIHRFFEALCQEQETAEYKAGCPFGNFAAALSLNGEEQNERFRARLSGLFRHIELAIRDCLAEGAGRGEFRTDLTPEDMALLVLATVEGLMMLTRTHQEVTPLRIGLARVQKMLQSV